MTVFYRCLAASFSLLVALAALEFGLGVYLPPKLPFARPDPRLLYRPEPGVAHHYTESAINGGGSVVSRMNSRGHRGRELGPKAAGVLRVVIFGDSFVHAVDTPLEATVPVLLEQELAERGHALETINAAVMGYGPDQQLVLLQEQLDELEPDLVVLAICAHNDLGDLLRNKLFRVGESGELLENDAQLRQRIHDQYAKGIEDSKRWALVRTWEQLRDRTRKSSDPGLAPSFLKDELVLRRREYKSYILNGDNSVFAFFADGYEADVALVPDSASARYKRRLARLVYGQFASVCRSRDIPVAFLVIPSIVDVVEDFDVEPDRARYARYSRAGLTDVFEELGAELDVPTLNLFDAMRAHGARELYKHGQDIHWNRAGQALAARELARFLEARGLLASIGAR